MSDVIETGQEWLASKLKSFAGRSITYTRSGTGSVTVTATMGRPPFRLSDGAGRLQLQWSDRDYLIDAADLSISGSTITPRIGDRITDGSETYEVQPPDNGEPCYRRSDPYGYKLRIHCKRVA